MKIPKYIQEIMDRSSYEISRGDIGHTIRIKRQRPIRILIHSERRLSG